MLTGKTALAKLIRGLIDPTIEDAIPLPNLHIAYDPLFKKHHVVICDNVRAISDFVSDRLCIRATGRYASTRELYTDSSVHAVKISEATIITSISSPIIWSDLQDKAVQLVLNNLYQIKQTKKD